jgi:DNA-binding MarR family transcriptional regulator
MTTARKPSRRATASFRDPTNSMGYLSRVAFRRFAKAIENRTLRHGVSGGQWRFLRVLWCEDGITQSELSRRVDMREPTTVVAIRGLERSGLVYRRADPDDQRKVRVLLTAKATALEETLIPYVAEVNAIAARGLSASDLRTARKVLMQLADNLAHEASERPGLADLANRRRRRKR